MPLPPGRLTVQDHSRDSAGMTYVYPVVSRRAGGISVGINLNPNNACNWRCIYCQVPDLKRGGPPPIDLRQLEVELADLLAQICTGNFFERHATPGLPPDARRVVDIAFSGNGEPTMAREFADAVACVSSVMNSVMNQYTGSKPPKLRLITNGSMLGRAVVQRGISMIGEQGGEVWFKIDGVGAATMRRINGIALQPETVLRRLRQCAGLCETWVQTCLFALDGTPQSADELAGYCALLEKTRDKIAGIHLYGLARPSLQPEAGRLTNLSAGWLEEQAEHIRSKTGLTVRVSP